MCVCVCVCIHASMCDQTNLIVLLTLFQDLVGEVKGHLWQFVDSRLDRTERVKFINLDVLYLHKSFS